MPIQIGNLARFEAARMRLEVRRPAEFTTLKITLSGNRTVIKRIFQSMRESRRTHPQRQSVRRPWLRRRSRLARAEAGVDELGAREAELDAASGNGAGTAARSSSTRAS